MADVTLVIGSKNLSSWSLRPWLFLKHHGVPFEEFMIELDRPATRATILEHSPSGRVPVLKHGAVQVWESLAICEYAAETFALPQAWPLTPAARALARSIAAEMHAGFADLRRELPFQVNRPPAPRQVSAKVAADIARIRAIWREARRDHAQGGGEWLFGRFGIADALFAPVALRFHTYAVPLEGIEREYMFSVLMHPAVQEWIDAAGLEPVAADAPPPPARATHSEKAAERTMERTLERTVEHIAELVKVSTVAASPEQLRPAPPASSAPRPAAAKPVAKPGKPLQVEARHAPKAEGESDPRTEPVFKRPVVVEQAKPAPAARKPEPKPQARPEPEAESAPTEDSKPVVMRSVILPPD